MTRLRAALRVGGAPARFLLISLIHLYRLTLGAMLGGQCRFYPSCSDYAEEAIRSRGAVQGSLFALWRIARCGPLTPGGIDPAPRPGSAVPTYDGVIPTRGSP
jgi:uncharacterized protein